MDRIRTGTARQLLEEATLIGDATRAILTQRGHDPSTVAQIGDMMMHAVDQQLRRFNGAVPAPAKPLDQGGQYKFVAPVDNSPPAGIGNVVIPADPKEEIKHEPEPERNDTGAVRWML